jgi:hypothetical protein
MILPVVESFWRRRALGLGLAVAAVLASTGQASAQTPVQTKAVTTPKEHFGFNIGDDYCLATYTQFESFVKKIEGQTDRLKVVSMGKTEEGRDQLLCIVTSPANHAKLPRLKEIAARMATAKATPEEARQLANEGKAVVWMDGGLHASEVLCAQVLTESVYQFVTLNDPETLRLLDDVVMLFVHANPDGMELCAGSYMRSSPNDPTQRRGYGNRLYEKYAGHDNNRDFYANNLAETRNMNKVMYREWFPQIVYNHHQSGPAGTVLFCPPFRDPHNYNVDPLVVSGIDAVGAAMMQRFLAEDKPGAGVRSTTSYSTWFNGGLRTASYFHNMIGILTETIGSPTPSSIPYLARMQLPRADYLAPIPPQQWHFRQSVDYSVTANRAILDYASRHRSQMLHNIWLMGANAIAKGNRDTWTVTPKMVEAAGGIRGAQAPADPAGGGGAGGGGGGDEDLIAFQQRGGQRGGGQRGGGQRGGRGGGNSAEFDKFFRDPAKRDPRGFILPADQPDFLTATKFINKLINSGCTVHRATADFAILDKRYPKGSYVVKGAQPFRAHVLDLFEPQDHPNDFLPGSTTPIRPYDIAGWTLAYQMAVKFDRILDGFDGPFEELKDEVPPPPAQIANATGTAGYFLDTRMNDAFKAVNRLLAAGEDVKRLQQPVTVAGTTYPAGTFFVARKASTPAVVEKIAHDVGTPFTGSATAPGREAVALKPPRIGLYDTGNSMPAGWTRLILEWFDYPYTTFTNLGAGNLRDKYDVLVFVEGGVGGGGGGRGGRGGGGGRGAAGGAAGGADRGAGAGGEAQPEQEPAGLPAQLKKFIEDGGVVFTSGGATGLARQLGLPLGNQLANVSNTSFYVPGSVLRTKVDPSNWLTWGLSDTVDVMFNNSPTFKVPEGEEAKGLKKIAWFDSKTPLRSGWAWGQEKLDGGVAVAEAQIGKGQLVLCGPQVTFRAQPHGTFKYLFNSITRAAIKE